MGKFLKKNKVVIILSGKYAGKKAVIVQEYNEGDAVHPYGHALVAGIARAPLSVTKRMSAKRQAKRSKLKPFVKLVNYNHIMPTRYTLDVSLDNAIVSKGNLKDAAKKAKARKEVKSKMEKRFVTGENKWFFSKLRF